MSMAQRCSDTYTKDNVDHLVRLAKCGDREALSELMRRYSRLVTQTARGILKNADDAEDVAQDVSLIVLNKLHTFEGQSAFSTWLTRIAINASLTWLRKAKRSRLSSLDEPAYEGGPQVREPSDMAPCPEQQYLCNEARHRLHDGIAKLPWSLRSVLADQIYLELPMVDVAKRQSLTLAAAKSRTLRARRILVHKLNRRDGSSQAMQ